MTTYTSVQEMNTTTSKAPPSDSFYKWFCKRFVASPSDAVISAVFLSTLLYLFYIVLKWAVFDAVWSAEDVDLCKETSGACWSVIDARHRLILFGLYPFDLHLRAAVACGAIVGTIILSCMPFFWKARRLLSLWVVGFATYYLLMEGSLLGLQQVTTDQWGGLALTLFLFSSVVLMGMPIGLSLALIRRSKLPVISYGVSIFIDTIRSLPLLTTLFAAAVVVPILLPDWLHGDKIWRVIIAFSLFFACYQAEVFRGGFQAIGKGQFEAGEALGLTYFQILRKIIMPQVFRHALPGTINMVVMTFKETAIVIIIGFFDILASANAAFGTGEWSPYYLEVYAFVGLIYWVFIFSLGQYGSYLKRRMTIKSR
jgi:general L-amino acid transport system permease protein